VIRAIRQRRRQRHRHRDRQRHRQHDNGQRLPAELDHLPERDAQAQQCDADAQHVLRRELYACGARPLARQKFIAMPGSSANSITGAP
jgi:hypothetical protein